MNEAPRLPYVIDETFDADAVLKLLQKRDPKLKPLFKKIGAFAPDWKNEGGPYDWLFRSIVYQQLHGKAAAAILARVRALFEDKKPKPAEFLAMDQAKLRAAGLSGNKLASLRDLSRAALSGEVPTARKVKTMSDEEIIESLLPIRGIGRWTVEMFLIFGLRRADILAVDDFALKKSAQILYKLPDPPNKKAFTELGEKWRPYRTVVCWYFWRALD